MTTPTPIGRWDLPIAITCPKCHGSNIYRYAASCTGVPVATYWRCHTCGEQFTSPVRVRPDPDEEDEEC